MQHSPLIPSVRQSEMVFAWPFETMPLDVFCLWQNKVDREGKPRRDWFYKKTKGPTPEFAEGIHYRRDPDGHYHVIIKGWDEWVKGNRRAA